MLSPLAPRGRGIRSVGEHREPLGLRGQTHGLFKRGEFGNPVGAVFPHEAGQFQRQLLGLGWIVVGGDDCIGLQIGHVGKGIANDDARGQTA